jgi:transposase
MRETTDDKINSVISLLKNGTSTRKIATRVGVSVATVSRIRNKFQVVPDGDMAIKMGRPTVLDGRMVRTIVKYIVVEKLGTAVNVTKALAREHSLFVSVETVRRALYAGGLASLEKKKRPILSANHQRDRYEWALEHQYWTMDDWKRVIWSDESSINRLGSDGRAWAWKHEDAPIGRDHVKETAARGGGSIMVWSCITWYGIGFMTKFKGTVNAELYLEVLKDELAMTINEQRLDPSKMVFMQDNASVHTARKVMDYLQDQRYSVMHWPAHSPDLNPIENMWALLKNRLFHNYETKPAGLLELWDRVPETWYAIEVDMVQRHIESMPRRVQQVIRNKGLWTKY